MGTRSIFRWRKRLRFGKARRECESARARISAGLGQQGSRLRPENAKTRKGENANRNRRGDGPTSRPSFPQSDRLSRFRSFAFSRSLSVGRLAHKKEEAPRSASEGPPLSAVQYSRTAPRYCFTRV